MVKTILLLAFCVYTNASQAQTLSGITLQQTFVLAEQNYPLLQQKGLLKQTEQLSIQNLSSNFLPQLSVSGQATYQSDVTQVNVPLPNVKIPYRQKTNTK